MTRNLSHSSAWALGMALAFAMQPSAQADDALAGLSLKQARALWQAQNYELELGRKQLEGTRFDEISAAQRPNPTVSLQSLQPTTFPQPNSNDTTLGISQLVERGNKRELRTGLAQNNTRVMQQEYSELQRAQGLMVSQAYFELKLAQDTLDIDKRMAELYRASLDAANKRLKEGDVPTNNVTQLRVEVARIDNQVVQAANALRKARLGLGYLLGMHDAKALALVASDAWMAVGSDVAGASEDAVAQRPDVRAASERLNAARAALELARAQLSPDVTVGLSAERHMVVGNTVGLNFSMPLNVNYQFQGEIGKAQNEITLAQLRIEQTQAQARQELAVAHADLEAARERLQRFEGGLLADAERAARSAELAFLHGASSVLELLDARRTHLATQIEAAAARADYAKARSAWYAALALLDAQ